MPRIHLTLKLKIGLTLVVTILVLTAGVSYQYFYNIEKAKYTETVTGYYRKHFKREPDPTGLNHWVMVAMNKWGLERVEKQGFIEAKGGNAS